MFFLVDYENIQSEGLEGIEYIEETDMVCLFYNGNNASTMRNKYAEPLYGSGCKIKIAKLQTPVKNALDFYIGAMLGELIGQGEEGPFAIISNDKGFQAVRDYWGKISQNKREIILVNSIEKAILTEKGKTERGRIVSHRLDSVKIEVSYAVHQKEIELEEKIGRLMAEAEIAGEVKKEPIREFLKKKETGKILYLDLLKSYGRQNGLRLYRAAKKCI